MAYYGFGSILPLNPLVAAVAGLPKNFTTGAMLKSSSPAASITAAYKPTPFVATGPAQSVVGVSSDPTSPAFFNVTGAGSNCPGCNGSAPTDYTQAYGLSAPATAAAPAGLVDVSVDTTPLLLLGLLALAYFAFRK